MGVSRTSIGPFSIGLLSGPKRHDEDDIKPGLSGLASGCWLCRLPCGRGVRHVLYGSKQHNKATMDWTLLAQNSFPLLMVSASQFSVGHSSLLFSFHDERSLDIDQAIEPKLALKSWEAFKSAGGFRHSPLQGTEIMGDHRSSDSRGRPVSKAAAPR